jgi:hypothetical protein
METSAADRARELARKFADHYVGPLDYPEGDDGLCSGCVEFAAQALLAEHNAALEEAADWFLKMGDAHTALVLRARAKGEG